MGLKWHHCLLNVPGGKSSSVECLGVWRAGVCWGVLTPCWMRGTDSSSGHIHANSDAPRDAACLFQSPPTALGLVSRLPCRCSPLVTAPGVLVKAGQPLRHGDALGCDCWQKERCSSCRRSGVSLPGSTMLVTSPDSALKDQWLEGDWALTALPSGQSGSAWMPLSWRHVPTAKCSSIAC